MSTKMGFWRWALASAAILIATATADARVIDPTGVTTGEPAAIVLYPKLKVDLNHCQGGRCSLTPDIICTSDSDCGGCNGDTCRLDTGIDCESDFECPGAALDTIVQLTNTSEFLTRVHCLYTNTNSHCSNDPRTICTDANFRDVCPRGGLCIPGWVETNFRLTLTKRQPISWSVNDGLSSLPLQNIPGQGIPPQFNEGDIPPAPEVPFVGELICIEVDTSTQLPSDRNDYKGEATFIKSIRAEIDAAKYNAIGIKAIEGRQDENPNVLNVGGPDAEYGVFNETVDPPRFAGCPNVLTLNHFFDGADVFTHDFSVLGAVHSEVTIVPCERDYRLQVPGGPVTVQFLIFNEFEQRFSTSTKVTCFKEVRLSDIDTSPGPAGDDFSIFSVGVQGTLTGMSRLRSVAGPDVDGYDGRTILAILEENWSSGVCRQISGGATPSGYIKRVVEQLCTSDADCLGIDGMTSGEYGQVRCVPQGAIEPYGTVYCEGGPGCTSTTAANVQFQGSRLQGDRITIPLP